MKQALILALLLPLSLCAQESAMNLASRFRGFPLSEQTMANLPKGREQEVLDLMIKEQAAGYISVLLRLNHGPTVERFVGGFIEMQGKQPFWRRYIEQSGSPYIIDELAPQLYKSDRLEARYFYEYLGSDFGESAQAAEMIGQLIIRAPEFSPEAKAWAKEHLGMPGNDIINAARAWWELNQAALLANQFDQVRQPESYPKGPPILPHVGQPSPPPAPSPAIAAPVTESAPPPPESSPTPAPDATDAVPVATPTKPPSAEPSSPRWWIVAALAILGAGLLIARRKKS